MIGISKLLIDKNEQSDSLRYGVKGHPGNTPSAANRPIVVFNCLRRCNLRCIHCYAKASAQEDRDLLDTSEAKAMIDTCADFGCPVMLFSGGEPLLREDLSKLVEHANQRGMRVTISTNGTLITSELAKDLKSLNIGYVGISLDGMEDTHDFFRGKEGAWRRALKGLEHCQEAGLRTGLRITLTQYNYTEIPDLFRLFEEREIPRICFYHLVYTGMGSLLRFPKKGTMPFS